MPSPFCFGRAGARKLAQAVLRAADALALRRCLAPAILEETEENVRANRPGMGIILVVLSSVDASDGYVNMAMILLVGYRLL